MNFFISYRRSDKDSTELADFLVSKLVELGHEVFIDRRMELGIDWSAEIARRIAWCDRLVVLLSDGALSSEMVRAEVRRAHYHRKTSGQPELLPVRVRCEKLLPYELDAYLGHLQYERWNGIDDSVRILASLSNQHAGLVAIARETTRERSPAHAENSPEPEPAKDPRVLARPGGNIRVDGFYVTRSTDADALNLVSGRAETLVIKAARQMGKSSLLIRYLDACRQAKKRVVFVDFQQFAEELHSYPALLTALVRHIIRALKLALEPPDIARQQEFITFMEDRILPNVKDPFVIAMDEVDRVMGREYQQRFFTLLRFLHNARASLDSPWETVGLALVISTEPSLLIDEEGSSPFNVTPPVHLQPFTLDEVKQLVVAYGARLQEGHVIELHDLLNGHPYLTRLALFRLTAPVPRAAGSAQPPVAFTFEQLTEQAAAQHGPFHEHLRALLLRVSKHPLLLKVLQQVIEVGSTADDNSRHRLLAAGLVREHGARLIPANLLYARFFENIFPAVPVGP